ncbi:MAG: hypothetical protein OEY67_00165 [Gammaproteobacteria bacterium]|nr:hypothetical protein [Gammaproteobacteria bacterium]
MTFIRDAVSPDKTYQVVAVEKTEPPAGMKGGSWYKYIIALEDHAIVGNRRGTLKQVTEYANECAENLSSRVARGTSTWVSRRKR